MVNTVKHNETKSGPRPVVWYKDFLGQESSSLIVIVLNRFILSSCCGTFSDLMVSKFNRSASMCGMNVFQTVYQKFSREMGK
jgi:hypothetical protein